MYVPMPQYHQQTVKSRERGIVSLATKLELAGFDKGPFSDSTVKGFLTQVAQLGKEMEENTAQERVSFVCC